MARFDQQYGPWAVVTGASSGLGAEFARQLADRGLDVVLVGRRRDALRERAAELAARGVSSRVLALDLLDPGAPLRLVNAVHSLDVGLVVHSAGALSVGAFEESRLEDELRLLDLNARVPLELSRRLAPRLAERGRGGLIFLSSFVAYRGGPNLANYTASKAWNLSFAESLGPELGPRGVDVLAVCPGFVDTPMIARFLPRLARVPSMPLIGPEPVVAAALSALGRRYSVIPDRWHLWLHRAMRSLPRDRVARLVGARTGRIFLDAPRSPRPPAAPPGARATAAASPPAPAGTGPRPATDPAATSDRSS